MVELLLLDELLPDELLLGRAGEVLFTRLGAEPLVLRPGWIKFEREGVLPR